MIIILFIVIALAICIIAYSIATGISPTPTNGKVKNCILQALPNLNSGVILELGSGWGHLVFPLADRFPKCKVIGYELSPVPWGWTKLRTLFKKRKNLQLARQNFYQTPLEEASIIVCYLFPGAMRKLCEKFEKELKPGTIVISSTFAIPSWKPVKILEAQDLYSTQIFIYQTPKLALKPNLPLRCLVSGHG